MSYTCNCNCRTGSCCPSADFPEDLQLTLEEIVNHYNEKFKETLEKELDNLQYYEEFVHGRPRKRGKNGFIYPKHPHQRRMTEEMAKNALERLRNVDKGRPIVSFEELYEKIYHPKIYGIGRLTAYDIALRYGHQYGVAPVDYVYLHAGAMDGAKELGNKGYLKKIGDRVSVSYFPAEIREIGSSHIENLLCIYKKVLKINLIQSKNK